MNSIMGIRAVLIFTLLALSLSVNAQEQSPQPNFKHHQKCSEKDQRGTELCPLVVKLSPSNIVNQASQPQATRPDGQSSIDWSMVLPTWLLAVFTLALCIYTAKMVQGTRLSMEATQRAFVYIKTFELQMVIDSEDVIIHPQWENSGDTPTRNMLNYVNWKYFEPDLPENYDFPDLSIEERIPVLIAPHATQYAAPLQIDGKSIDSVIAGRGHIYIWGWAEYDDVFSETSRHRTEFCYQVLMSPLPDKKIYFRFRVVPKHNGADGECLKKATPYLQR